MQKKKKEKKEKHTLPLRSVNGRRQLANGKSLATAEEPHDWDKLPEWEKKYVCEAENEQRDEGEGLINMDGERRKAGI